MFSIIIHENSTDWWHRVFPTNRPLGGKEIDSIVVTLRNCVENKSNEEIASIFRPDDDLELRFKFLIFPSGLYQPDGIFYLIIGIIPIRFVFYGLILFHLPNFIMTQ